MQINQKLDLLIVTNFENYVAEFREENAARSMRVVGEGAGEAWSETQPIKSDKHPETPKTNLQPALLSMSYLASTSVLTHYFLRRSP